MENATKALLIGAGMLFAIAIVSMIIYAYTQLTGYYGEEQSSMTKEQLTEFNSQYEAYNRDDVTGFELVSLINKIIDYNANNAVDESLGFNNTDKDFKRMYIKFTLDNSLTSGIDGVVLFPASDNPYDSRNSRTNTKLEDIMNRMHTLENTYGANVLSKLVSNRESFKPGIKDYGGTGSKDIKQVLGKDVAESNLPSKNELLLYEQYIEFKRAKFRCTETDYNSSTGRITDLIFEQI